MGRCMARLNLRDDQWERIAHLLPGKPGERGCTAADKRLFVEAVLWMARSGAPWRDLPETFGPWNSVYKRFARRQERAYTTYSAQIIVRQGTLGSCQPCRSSTHQKPPTPC